jgi:hypothetical protein
LRIFQRKKNDSSKLAYDFVADIPDVDIHEFYSDLKQQLTSDYKIINETVEPDQICSTFSTKWQCISRYFIGSNPPEFTCYIKNNKQAVPTVCTNFSFPRWFLLFLYYCIFMIDNLLFLILYKKNMRFNFHYNSVGMNDPALFIVTLVVTLSFCTFLLLYTYTLPNYKKKMQDIITDSYQRCTKTQKKIYHDWYKLPFRYFIYQPIIYIQLFFLILCGYLFGDKSIVKDIFNILGFRICFGILIFLIFIFWKIITSDNKDKDPYDARKMLTLVTSLYFGSCLIIATYLPVISISLLNQWEPELKDTYAHVQERVREYGEIGYPRIDNRNYEYDGRVKAVSFLVCMFQISILVTIFFLLFCYRTGFQLLSGFPHSIHYKGVCDVLPANKYKGNIKRRLFYKYHELSVIDKCFTLTIMLVASSLCWTGMFYSFSVMAALCFTQIEWLTTKFGEITLDSYFILAHAWQGFLEITSWTYLLRTLFLLPMMFPFFLLMLACFAAYFVSNRMFRQRSEIGGELALRIKRIARDMELNNVKCVVVSKTGNVCKADIRGIIPRNYIFFSETFVTFLEKKPRYIEPIIAHEMAHLKLHCRRLRWLRILSRLSLLGSGATGIFINSVKIEDQADRLAVIYLKKKKLNPMLLGEAIESLRNEFRNKPDHTTIYLNVLSIDLPSESEPESQNKTANKKSLIFRFWNFVKLIFEVYFLVDCYDYIHLPISIRQRRMQNIIKYR